MARHLHRGSLDSKPEGENSIPQKRSTQRANDSARSNPAVFKPNPQPAPRAPPTFPRSRPRCLCHGFAGSGSEVSTCDQCMKIQRHRPERTKPAIRMQYRTHFNCWEPRGKALLLGLTCRSPMFLDLLSLSTRHAWLFATED